MRLRVEMVIDINEKDFPNLTPHEVRQIVSEGTRHDVTEEFITKSYIKRLIEKNNEKETGAEELNSSEEEKDKLN